MRKIRSLYWPPRIVPPKGVANVLLIMTDDQGYGVSEDFGGVIPTPAMDRIAKAGLRYTQFHSTALCSPTRAALITGRNHHSVGYGVIGEMSDRFPGYDSVIGEDDATIGEILKENGYATSWFGKNHNTPTYLYSAAGPFDQWPIGMGFQYFYGFMGGETDQWTPYLYQNTTPIFPMDRQARLQSHDRHGRRGHQVYEQPECGCARPAVLRLLRARRHSFAAPTEAGVEGQVQRQVRHGLGKVARTNLCQSEAAWCDPGGYSAHRLAGRSGRVWRREVAAMGLALAGAEKLYAREAENFAGYAAYTDNEIGRAIQAVEDMGKLDNTIIIYISGDNGTSAEGTVEGTFNQMTAYNGILDPTGGCAHVELPKAGVLTRLIRTCRSHRRGRSTPLLNGPSRWPHRRRCRYTGARGAPTGTRASRA